MHDTISQQGIDLMLFGMGTVFVFLTLLIIATAAMSSLIQKFMPEPESEVPGFDGDAPSAVSDPRLHAIIKAAIDRHRGKK